MSHMHHVYIINILAEKKYTHLTDSLTANIFINNIQIFAGSLRVVGIDEKRTG